MIACDVQYMTSNFGMLRLYTNKHLQNTMEKLHWNKWYVLEKIPSLVLEAQSILVINNEVKVLLQ